MTNENSKKELEPICAKFSAPLARIVSAAMAEKDIRYYLNGIHVEPYESGVLITATDGITLLSAYDENGKTNREFICSLNSKAISACSKHLWSAASRSTGKTISVNGTRLTVHDGNDEELFVQPKNCIIEGNYPKWRELENVGAPPMREELVAAGDLPVDFSHMAKLLRRFPAPRFGSSSVLFWRRACADKGRTPPVFLEFQGFPILGILMPRRDRDTTNFWYRGVATS